MYNPQKPAELIITEHLSRNISILVPSKKF